MAAARAAVNDLLVKYRDRHALGEQVGVRAMVSRDAVYAYSERLSRDCERNVAVLVPDLTPRPEGRLLETLDTAVLSPEISVRYVFLDSVRKDQAAAPAVSRLVSSAAQARTAPFLPPSMTIFDKRVAIIDADQARPQEGSFVLDSPGPVAALCALFDGIWQQAHPFCEPVVATDERRTRQEVAVTELLAAGYTDEVIARRLGVSVRTARRTVAELMKRLRASSRFQAGVRAAERGWLSWVPGARE
ncbi:helix-turn-helix transcriptional regulator [Micromonospora sp. NPDC005215]|uniref:helix-turn-helix transcriptional regulator n=1 Tax=Micromonospora sp. NPDC005215 TaxID=3157024 RepID=UPI0033BE0B3D